MEDLRDAIQELFEAMLGFWARLFEMLAGIFDAIVFGNER